MKKIFCLVIALMIFPALSLAEVDLKEMTTEELIELKTAIAQELISRNEMKEVPVPAGKYTVGEDIPVGNYTVYANSAACMITVNEYQALYYLNNGEKIGKLVLNNGDIVDIVGNCIFTPYQGLGF